MSSKKENKNNEQDERKEKKEQKEQKEQLEKDNIEEDIIEEVEEKEPLDNKENGLAISKYKEKRKLSRTSKIIILSVSIFIALICITFGIITCINKLNTKVYKNVYMLGENFSGKTSEEVIEIITNKSNELSSNEKIDVYQNGENIYTVKAEDLEFKFDIDKTAQSIMDFGRNKNIFINNFNVIKALFSKVDIQPVYVYDNEKFDNIIKNIDLSIKDRYVDDSYSLDEKNAKLIIVNGKKGNSINYDEEKNRIIEKFKTPNENTYDLVIEEKNPQKLDPNKVYEEVKREAKDAYIDKSVSPQKYVSEVIGLDFDVNSLKETLALPENQEEGKTIEFNINVIQPKVRLADITADLCKDKLAGYTTYFPAGSYARSNNLKIALSYMNGVVVMPGETYSYNKNIGDTTASKGYQAAATFKGGTTVNEMGGGICQTVSTLYNVALMANLEIVERHQHGLPVGYVPPSRDATVYSPVLDFKFKNNRETPIKIVTSFTYGGSLNVSIYGTKQANDPEVILSQKTLSTIPYTTKYEYDPGMPYGQQVVVSAGVNGYTSESYITKKLNGQIISSSLLSKDKYNPQQQVVRVGTGGS